MLIFTFTCIYTCIYAINRVLSAVMYSLVRNQLVSSQESNAEMSQFCMQFLYIKEASNLYQLLRRKVGSNTGSSL